jgi:hypothetical protein
MDSYLDTAITEMTPMEKAKLRMEISKGNLNDETAVRMQTLLGPQTQYLQAHIDEVKAITNSTNSLVGPKTKQILGTYADAIAHAGLATEQADYYAQKVQTGVAMGGLNGPELGDAVKAFSEGMRVQTSLIQTGEATKRSLMGNTNYSIPGSGRDQIQHQINQINDQENGYRSRLNGYQSQLQSLVGGIQGPAQGGTQPPGQNPSGNKPPPSDPPTQMHNGKMYYLHPDGKYYTAPPQAGQ